MVKDKSKPKGALTPYAVFVQSMRDEHKKKHPSASVNFAEFSKECSTKWKTLGPKDKKKYEDIAAKDKERYAKQMKTYVPQTDDGKKKRRKKDPNAPKKPLSAFFLFCQDERGKIRQQHPEWTVGQSAKELAVRWSQCKNKSKYESQATVEKARYGKAMEKYNAKKSSTGSESP